MPEEYAEYLAYKMIIEYDQLTKDERDEIFTEKGVLLLIMDFTSGDITELESI